MIDRFYVRGISADVKRRLFVMKLGNGQYISGVRHIHRTEEMIQSKGEQRTLLCHASFNIGMADRLDAQAWGEILNEDHPLQLGYPDGARLVEVMETIEEIDTRFD